MEVIPRAQAKLLGRTTYFTGRPCKHGHVAPRAVVSGTCCACTDAASAAWKKRNPERAREYVASYRERNREAVRERDKDAKKRLRLEYPEEVRSLHTAWYKKKVELKGREYRPNGRLPETKLVERLRFAHEGKYLYVNGYVGMLNHAVFYCTVHKLEVTALPHNILRGADPCYKCNHTKSNKEAEVAAYLSMFTTVIPRDRSILRPKELDIYLPERSFAVEYCGMYWHSHGDAEDERKRRLKHYTKYTLAKERGVRLITLYETEWIERNFAVRRMLRNALGRGRGRLMARKCTLQTVEASEARRFFDRYHPQGGNGSGIHYGLYWKDKLVACMRFANGINDRGAAASARSWTLSRFATRVTVAGAASRLFKMFQRAYAPAEVKSFSDNRFFDGAMYAALGFTLEEETPPDYQVWSPQIGLRPKSHYQRRLLPQRLLEHGVDDEFVPETDPRTEAEMTFLMRARRIYDCGKKRWVWRAAIAS